MSRMLCYPALLLSWIMLLQPHESWSAGNLQIVSSVQALKTFKSQPINLTPILDKSKSNKTLKDFIELHLYGNLGIGHLWKHSNAQANNNTTVFSGELLPALKLKFKYANRQEIGYSYGLKVNFNRLKEEELNSRTAHNYIYYDSFLGRIFMGHHQGLLRRISSGYHDEYTASSLVNSNAFLLVPMSPTQYLAYQHQDNYYDPYDNSYEYNQFSYSTRRLKGLRLAVDYVEDNRRLFSTHFNTILRAGINFVHENNWGLSYMLSVLGETAQGKDGYTDINYVEYGFKLLYGNFSLSGIYGDWLDSFRRQSRVVDSYAVSSIDNNLSLVAHSTQQNYYYYEILLGYRLLRYNLQLGYFNSKIPSGNVGNIKVRLTAKIHKNFSGYVELGDYLLTEKTAESRITVDKTTNYYMLLGLTMRF